MTPEPRPYLAVAAGSALGAVARYLCSLWALAAFGGAFPWGTLAVNVAGSFLIGFYAEFSDPAGRAPAGPAMRQFVTAGFCGGFTTFSMFSLETLLLVENGRVGAACAYVGASVPLWLGAAWLGHRAAFLLNSRQP